MYGNLREGITHTDTFGVNQEAAMFTPELPQPQVQD